MFLVRDDTLLFVGISSSLMAKPHHDYYQGRKFGHHESRRHHEISRPAYHHDSNHRASVPQGHSHITCDMVRSYVAQVGLAQAKAMAEAAGMTASEERRARQCLLSGV